jgi:hypothetical protein
VEFEVRDAQAVQSAADELRQEGSIIGISFAPALHD